MTELEFVKKKIRFHMNEIADDLAGGAAVDYPNYRYLVGIVSGLAMIEREILDYEKSMADED